ncbi:MarR family winged helix-turn-helix transcriptional regulator [Brenneria goodwinii]|uniref:Transcriptional regulator, MarR family n=1 Tax=Brenneria goodwinii TaxID=1109412 RepID=A0A0G4JYP1_9GAMM|nr:MarR family winged helix-turn-helix transcriptional regulator [Brenneria goodwinii]CPR18618.1 Transcriptional regulator, MarR family [Brenneria goodwinii]
MANKTKILIDYVTFRLDILVNFAKQEATEKYEQASGVNLRELRILRYAAIKPGLSQRNLAALCYLEKTQISKMVSGLVNRGLLLQMKRKSDSRTASLWLTDAGQEVVNICDQIGTRLENEMMSVLTKEEEKIFRQNIEKIINGLAVKNIEKNKGKKRA